MLTEQLKQLGLTDGEAKAYEALVGLGPSTVGPIVKRSGIAYSNIYEVLQRLAEKGLVTHITREDTKVFSAVPPHRLQEYLEKREEEIARSKMVLDGILPALNNLQAAERGRADAEVFLGSRGLRTAYDLLYDEMACGAECLYFNEFNPAYAERMIVFYAKEWPRMRKLKITARGILHVRDKNTIFDKKLPSFLKKHERYIAFPVPGNIDIVKDKILITSWEGEPVGILIHSQQVAQNFRDYFEAVWKMAKK
jgi:sugar-specific transcriptional regulator TrmB